MSNITSYVFFDIEATGLPYQERNQTKITELSMVATLRKDLQLAKLGEIPPVSKLTLVFNPERQIHPYASEITGLTNNLLKNAPKFRQKERSIVSFLEDLPKPVCLVAHNGNTFDFKLLLAECKDANIELPLDLLCVDSLVGFRKICKQTPVLHQTDNIIVENEENITNNLTDDEDEWPDLNLRSEDIQDIDDLCTSLSGTYCNEEEKAEKKINTNVKSNSSKAIKNLFSAPKPKKESFALSPLYERLLNKKVIDAHRAEADCLILLECVVAKKEFLNWVDTACKKLSAIAPLKRY